jgi:hypothetical protein
LDCNSKAAILSDSAESVAFCVCATTDVLEPVKIITSKRSKLLSFIVGFMLFIFFDEILFQSNVGNHVSLERVYSKSLFFG